MSHPSIIKIKGHFSLGSFSFPHIEPWEVAKVLKELDSGKSISGSVPTKLWQMVISECCIPLTDCIN